MNLLVLVASSLGGLFFGAMPGLSPTMAVALMVPFTFYMPPTTSLIMLGAVYTSSVAGGSISAILLSIPGAPASIATLMEGPAMAKQGRAEEALYTSFCAHVVGGVFGVLVLICFAPPLARFAMRFGPSELFWTAVFGITVITGLSSGSMLKGLFGGALGTVIGIIPGAGGQIAGLMAYDQVKKLNKHPKRFGKGNPEGLCASEAANNATVGPALIPMLTLGIPGSPTAAVLLGGLLIHGLFPGPDLFSKHADVTYTFLGGLLLAQFAMFALGILASRYSQYVANVPNHIMFGAVVILCVFGSYCVSNNFADVLIMFVLGMVMFVLNKLGFPSAPLVLGIILGPIAEENFLRGKMIAETDVGLFSYFCTGELNLMLIALSVFSFAWGIVGEIKYARKRVAEA